MKHRIMRLALGVISLACGTGLASAQTYHALFLECAKGFGTAVADYNNDGHDDVFITGHDEDDRIWYWDAADGGVYVPSEDPLPHVDRHDCDAGDVNRDQRMDFYCAVGAEKGLGTGANQLWLQQTDGTFQLMEGHGAEDLYGSSRRPILFDFNHDGWPDIYSTNELHVRADSHETINRLFVSDGLTIPHFHEVQTRATGSLGWGCVAKGDLDGDGWDDLLICTDDPGKDSVILRNTQYIDNDFELITPPAMQGRKMIWAQLRDLNHDNKPDLIGVFDSNTVEVWLNSGAPPFFTSPRFVGALNKPGKSLTVGDFNGDTWPDIYVVRANTACQESMQDNADDFVFWGHEDAADHEAQWDVASQLTQHYRGCGHEAQTLDNDKVLLVNGTSKKRGPNYVLSWSSEQPRKTRSRKPADDCMEGLALSR